MNKILKSFFGDKSETTNTDKAVKEEDFFSSTTPLSATNTGIEVEELTFEQYLQVMRMQGQ